MDLFEKQAQLQSLFQTSPVDAAYAQGTQTGRKIAGTYADLDVALLLLNRVKANEFFDYQVYFVSELSKALETEGLDVVTLNRASLLQRAQVIRSWSLLYQRDEKRRVLFEARSVMEYLEFKKYDEIQSKALASPGCASTRCSSTTSARSSTPSSRPTRSSTASRSGTCSRRSSSSSGPA